MDKLLILKELKKLKLEGVLSTDEIRLYLLLLAACRGTGEGKIGVGPIRGALGEGFIFGRLKEILHNLQRHGLVEVVSLKEAEGKGFKLAYRIFPGQKIGREVRYEGTKPACGR